MDKPILVIGQKQRLELLKKNERADFAATLATARFMWQKYPALVEAEEFPTFLGETPEELLGSCFELLVSCADSRTHDNPNQAG